MDTCNHCGQATEHAFPCNHCNQSFCGEHRLPENHDCPVFAVDVDLSSFAGEGPDTPDRRSTQRKRIERVREKPDLATEPGEVSQYIKEQSQSSEADTDVLTCSTCGSDTHKIFDCDQCGISVCPNCEGQNEHECSPTISDIEEDNAEHKTLLSKVFALFR